MIPARGLLPLLLVLAGLLHRAPAHAGVRLNSAGYTACVCAADFDHDGLADHGTLSPRAESTFIQIALTGRRKPLRLHAGAGVLNVAAFDIDRDGNVDLVALRADFRLRVWFNNGRGEFVRRSRSRDHIRFGSDHWTRHRSKASPCCHLNGYSDPAEACANVRAAAVAVQPARGHPVGLRPQADPCLASLHPRPPPSPAV